MPARCFNFIVSVSAACIMNDITTEIPAGDLQLYDYYKPPLEAGNHTITVTQAVPGMAGAEKFEATQEFVVSAPQFVLDPTQIVNQYPPAGSTGKYGEVLPHIVLRDPMLAWERSMQEPAAGALPEYPVPWLALLVFEEGDLLSGDGQDPSTQTTTAGILAFQALNGSQNGKVLAPTPDIADDIQAALADETAHPGDASYRVAHCQYIRMPAAVFIKVVPRLDELCYLSHVRKVNTGDRPALGLSEHGLYSVTMANRFPSVPPTAVGTSKNIVHLVSLEGMAAHLKGPTVPAGCEEVALLSLASWTFSAQHDQPQDFKALAELLAPAGSAAESRWLRLQPPPPPALPKPPIKEELEDARDEVQRRLDLGYTPLAYHTRSGETTMAWYRGPLVPQPTSSQGLRTFPSADSALIYDTSYDVFDVSLAAAWELGREVALADVAFGPKLLHFRRNASQVLDTLHHQVNSAHLAGQDNASLTPKQQPSALAKQLAKLEITTVQDAFARLLTDEADPLMVKNIGAVGTQDYSSAAQTAGIAATLPNRTSAPAVGNTQAELKKTLSSVRSLRGATNKLHSLLAEDIAPLAEWLGRFLLLSLVPFDNLVPDERLLPAESLRFFYLDEQWFQAALDGALSLGLDSSKHDVINGLVKKALLKKAKQAASTLAKRQETSPVGKPLTGKKQPSALPNGISGFLLRSEMVVGWPNLAVYPKNEQGEAIPILRIDHLAPNILLCLFDGVPKQLVLSEPPESLRFGIDEEGAVALRNFSGTAPIGQQLEKMVPVRDMEGAKALCMRTTDSRVLNLAPGSPALGIAANTNGLISTLKEGFSPSLRELFSPSAFSLQLVKAPEALLLPKLPNKA
jgi:hypothetical protein